MQWCVCTRRVKVLQPGIDKLLKRKSQNGTDESTSAPYLDKLGHKFPAQKSVKNILNCKTNKLVEFRPKKIIDKVTLTFILVRHCLVFENEI